MSAVAEEVDVGRAERPGAPLTVTLWNRQLEPRRDDASLRCIRVQAEVPEPGGPFATRLGDLRAMDQQEKLVFGLVLVGAALASH